MKLLFVFTIFLVGRTLPANDFNFELAKYHAPIICENVGNTPRADEITRFDFDGDFVADNNWNHLDDFAEPAFVYYSVIESETHYFILYAFYHVRDYKNMFGHENDLEGATLTVEKDGSTFGSAKFVETIAHNDILSATPELITDRRLSDHKRVALFVEAKGHGVHSISNQASYEKCRDRKQTKFIYYFGGRVDDPTGTVSGNVSYGLLPIVNEFWNKLHTVVEPVMFRNYYSYSDAAFKIPHLPSEFKGSGHSIGTARPPWGWTSSSDPDLPKGSWFFNPALSVSRHFRVGKPFSMKYVRNLYMNIMEK